MSIWPSQKIAEQKTGRFEKFMKKYYGLLFGAKLTDEEIIEELVGKSREFFIERFRLFVDFNLLNYIIG